MAKESKILARYKFTCDSCGKLEEVTSLSKLKGWIHLQVMEGNGLRMFEKKIKQRRFETFHLKHRKREVDYCSSSCANKDLLQSIQLFVAEVSPITKRKGFKSLT